RTRWSRSGRTVSATGSGRVGRSGPESWTVTGTAEVTLTVRFSTPAVHAAEGTENVPFAPRTRGPVVDPFTQAGTLEPLTLFVTVSSPSAAKVGTRARPESRACQANTVGMPTSTSAGADPSSRIEVAIPASRRGPSRDDRWVASGGDPSAVRALGPVRSASGRTVATRRASATNARRAVRCGGLPKSGRTTVTRAPAPLG